MDVGLASSVLSGSVLGLIDDPITKDLQESQSKLIGARWIGLAASEDESGFLRVQRRFDQCQSS